MTVTQLLAPFTPFVADEIYDNLDGSEPSRPPRRTGRRPASATRTLEFAMATVRETVRLGLAARGQAKLKVRQPLRAAVVVAAGGERAAIERLADVALEELNVKELRYVSQADELGSYEVKPNYRALGPRFGKSMPQVAAAVAALDPQHVAGALRDGGRVGHLDRRPRPRARHRRPDARDEAARRLPARARGLPRGRAGARARRRAASREGLAREIVHARGARARARRALRREGLAREIVHAIQNARKNAGLQVEDRIALLLGGDDQLLDAAREHEPYVARETLATSVTYDGAGGVEPVTIEGQPLHIAVAKA